VTKRKAKPKAVKVRRPMPPPSKVMPDDRRRLRDQDIERLISRRDEWEDGPYIPPPNGLK
jgi:hypothetical protein